VHIAFKFKYTHDNGLFTRLLNRISERSALPLSLYHEGSEYRVEASGEQPALEILAEEISALVAFRTRSYFLSDSLLSRVSTKSDRDL